MTEKKGLSSEKERQNKNKHERGSRKGSNKNVLMR